MKTTTTTKMLKITGCTDGMRWYAGLVGELVPYRGDVGDEYRSVDQGGFTNFVQYDDCEIVEVDTAIALGALSQ